MTLQEFAKNINGEFALSPSYMLSIRDFDIKMGSVNVKISEIDKQDISVNISSSEGLGECARSISQEMILRLEKGVKKQKRISLKVIKEWENNPDNFKFKKEAYSGEKIYIHESLLKDSEYSSYIGIFFDKISISCHDLTFSTGYGSSTHHEKGYYEEGIEMLDVWLVKEVKKIKSAAFIKRVINQIKKHSFDFSIFKAHEYLSIPTKDTKKVPSEKSKKKPFPFSFSADDLNDFLTECGGRTIYIDSEIIEELSDGFKFPLADLEEWEIISDTDGHHNHDGDMCEYTVTFTSPDGHDYHLYNTHSLYTSWNFDGDQTPG